MHVGVSGSAALSALRQTHLAFVMSAGVADPFAVGGGGAAAAAGPSPPSAPAAAQSTAQPVRPVGDINEWFRKLCQAPSGVLYEDNYLQVCHWSRTVLAEDWWESTFLCNFTQTVL